MPFPSGGRPQPLGSGAGGPTVPKHYVTRAIDYKVAVGLQRGIGTPDPSEVSHFGVGLPHIVPVRGSLQVVPELSYNVNRVVSRSDDEIDSRCGLRWIACDAA